ncbi:ATP synthase subunits region ORF 7-like [Branchiostoma lanceolatum]|uniref:ATP synthase subunits region ORF 7-like n=1 Tax=Branchiostoma lanceolatum TaxID=7740 RepID=UPI0034512006
MKAATCIFLCILSVIAASEVTGDVAAPNSLETLEKQLQDLKAQVHQLQAKSFVNHQRDPLVYVERCESGIAVTGYAMYGNGIRTQDLPVLFSRAFRRTPVVTVGLKQLDHGNQNVRVTVAEQSITTTGMIVRVGTFADSVLYGLTVNWMACA